MSCDIIRRYVGFVQKPFTLEEAVMNTGVEKVECEKLLGDLPNVRAVRGRYLIIRHEATKRGQMDIRVNWEAATSILKQISATKWTAMNSLKVTGLSMVSVRRILRTLMYLQCISGKRFKKRIHFKRQNNKLKEIPFFWEHVADNCSFLNCPADGWRGGDSFGRVIAEKKKRGNRKGRGCSVLTEEKKNKSRINPAEQPVKTSGTVVKEKPTSSSNIQAECGTGERMGRMPAYPQAECGTEGEDKADKMSAYPPTEGRKGQGQAQPLQRNQGGKDE